MIDKKEEFDEIKFERDIMDGVYLPIIGTTCAHDMLNMRLHMDTH